MLNSSNTNQAKISFNPFPHRAFLQQTTLYTSGGKTLLVLEMKLLQLDSIEIIVTKEEIAPKEQFLPLPQCFQMSSATSVG